MPAIEWSPQAHLVLGLLAAGAIAACAWITRIYWRVRTWTNTTEAFDAERQHIVEMIAQNQNLRPILDRIARGLQRLSAGAGVAVLLNHDGRLTVEVHADIPEQLLPLLEGNVGDAAGASPCFVRSPQWLSIAESRCAGIRDLAVNQRIGGFWASALTSGANEILGVLTVFPKSSCPPGDKETKWFEMAGRLSAIAIEQRNVVDELNYRAEHDPLTLLYNRVTLEKKLQESIQTAGLTNGVVCLLYIDIDRFKIVNGLLGRQVGDAVLQQVAVRFANYIPSHGFLARAGGDEFVVVLPLVQPLSACSRTAQALLDCLQESFFVGGHEIQISASIGVSLCPDHATDSLSLERNAYAALVQAKKLGRSQLLVYQPNAERESPERLEIERHLRFAMRNNELRLAFQPQVDLHTGRLVGVECLLRWRHSQLGDVSPATFVPIAEEAGFIVPIGAWVLEEACRQLVHWRSRGLPRLRLSVNVSAAQFDRPDFLDLIQRILQSTGADPSGLVIELTESAVMQNRDRSLLYMGALRDMGIELSLDDFGTGQSALAQLQKLPIHELKIDRSFVREIRSLQDRPPLVECVVALAKRLGLRTIAEGVEDTAQWQVLTAMGCDEGQGYLFSRPLESAEIPSLMSANWTRIPADVVHQKLEITEQCFP